MKTSNKIILSTFLILLCGWLGFLFALRANMVEPELVKDLGDSYTINYNDMEDYPSLFIDLNNTRCEVDLVVGEPFVKIETYDQIKDYVKYEQNDNGIKIYADNAQIVEEGALIKMTIGTGNQLNKLDIRGRTKIISNAPLTGETMELMMSDIVQADLIINTNFVNAHINDLAYVKLEGGSKKLELSCSDSSKLEAKGFQSAVANVRLSDLGTATINAYEVIEASVSDAAKLYYTGDASIQSQATDLGSVNKVD